MKSTILPIVVAAICMFSSCDKLGRSGSMTAKINGTSFTASECSVQGSSEPGLHIGGTRGTKGYGIQLSIKNYTPGATGTFPVTAWPDRSVVASVDTTGMGQSAKSGTITINKSTSKTISGTFSFTCENGSLVWNVTDGVFEAVNN